jgi:glycosyltransferase involved in cell wall biosynthesis
MCEAPRVSIVTLSFNQGRFLEGAIRSVIDQSYPALEYVVVDPGSVDDSRAIIERYRDRIDYCVFKPDNGPAQGLNHGFSTTTGEIFGFVNADDLLLPDAVRLVANYFCRHPNVDVLLGCGIWIDEDGRVLKHVVPSHFSIGAAAHGRFEFMQQATFIRRTLFERCGGFNESNRICWDGELLIDLAKSGARFGRSSLELGAFRFYQGTITDSNGYLKRLRQEEARIFANVIDKPQVVFKLTSILWLVRKWLFDPWYVLLRLARNFS